MLPDKWDERDDENSDGYTSQSRPPNEIQPRGGLIGYQILDADHHCRICGGDYSELLFTDCDDICDVCLIELDDESRRRWREQDPLYEKLVELQKLVRSTYRNVRAV